MNESLSRLANLFRKESRLIIGLMSGTSLDGLDIALCKLSGSGVNTNAEIIYFETAPYTEEFKDDLRAIFSKKQVDLEKVTLLNAKIGTLHAELINQFLKTHHLSNADIDCIASHGQTIYHAPQRLHQSENYPNATLQIGDADHIAVKTGLITISDFRQKHVAAGGEGAPLALYGDAILFSSPSENRILLNIGGISNFTYLPRQADGGQIICTDAGPGNTLIDMLCKKHFKVAYDKGGEIARQGKVNTIVLDEMLGHSFFKQSFPKTTGPELFNLELVEQALASAGMSKLAPADLISTATQFTAESVARAIKEVVKQPGFTMYASGGGANNTYLLESISKKFPENKILRMEALGVPGDAKEALLFALLANETICGSSIETNAGPAVMMGKISLPG